MSKLFVVVAFLASSAALYSQTAPLACEGRRATVRVSGVTDSGTAKGFMDAVAAHRAWVSSHGLAKDEIITVPVIERDEKTRARSYSTKTFLSIHIHGSNQPDPTHDEAYDEFVKLYRANSDIKSAYDICLPNSSLK
jgi:hypothetical protein